MDVITRPPGVPVRPAESRAAAGGEPDGIDARLRERLRTLLCCLCLVLLATATRPGRIIGDTKIDMALNPAGFLGRALHLWDAEQFGQLQNQAGGYLFPMGPFYLLGHLAGVPPWITQRAWLALLLCTAFLGANRLAGRLGIGTPHARRAGAFVFALSPYGLAALGINSSEYLPQAMIPWMVLPLVGAARGGPRVRAAARSGLAVACCGGINGAAAIAALAVPALFVVTRPWGRRATGRRSAVRVRILAWWGTAVVFATAWWSVPLLLLDRYAYSWLPYTEHAATTTATTGPDAVLRGAQRWTDYLFVDGHAWWPLGNALATHTLPILCTGAIAALGLAGLLRARLPERAFLVVTLLTGLTIMVAGHAGPFAPAVRDVIDGPLAPFRNLYKFDGLVRLPLAFGVAHLLSGLPDGAAATRASGLRERARWWPAVAAAAALAGVALSALSMGLSAAGDFAQVPDYWRAASAWLNARAGEQGVLEVPGARFGEYTWGRPMDDIAQPLLRVRWAARELVPAGSAGFTRLLDAIDQRISSGYGSAGLAEVLGRMGIRYILVRNDLRRDDLRGAWPARVHEALDGSRGLKLAAWFGHVPAGSDRPDDAATAFDQPYPPVEIYEVEGAADAVDVIGADDALRLYGSPEALLTMADDGLLRGRTVLFGDDGPGTPAQTVVADSLRRVDRDFGEIRGQSPATMTATDEPHVPGQKRDILEPGWDRYSTVAEYAGIKNVTASSSAADIAAVAGLDQPGGQPYAAVDGNQWTSWETGGLRGPVGQWLRVDFDRPITPHDLTVTFVEEPWLGPPPERVSVETESGRVEQRVARTSDPQPVGVPTGPTRWLRLRIDALASRPAVPAAARVAVSELRVDGVRAVRDYRLPAVPGGGAVVMARAPGTMDPCMKGTVRWVCSPELERQDEEPYSFDRRFSMAASGAAALYGTATLTDPDRIERYTTTGRLVIRASSTLTRGAADVPRSAFDANAKTTWMPASADRAPWLSLSWHKKIRIGRIKVWRPGDASGLTRVRVEGDGGQWRDVPLDATGVLSFKPMRTSSLTLRFPDSSIEVSDLTVPGVEPYDAPPSTRVTLPCGFGPDLWLDGVHVRTRAAGTFGDLLTGRPLPFRACETVKVRAGDNVLTPTLFDPFRVDSVVVNPANGGVTAGPASSPAPVTVTRWTAGGRQVTVAAASTSYLVVNENYNRGWQARIGGRLLRPARIDGWRQAWVLPAGTKGTVRLTYAPDRVYHAALLAGFALLVVLLLAALWPSRRRAGPPPRRRPPASGIPGAAAGCAVVAAAAAIAFWIGGPRIGLGHGTAGLWTGTALAAAATAVLAAVLLRPPERLRRAARSPWLPAAAMLASTVCTAVGLRVRTAGDPLDTPLTATLPRLLCMVVVAALLVSLRRRDDQARVPCAGDSRPPAPPTRDGPPGRPVAGAEPCDVVVWPPPTAVPPAGNGGTPAGRGGAPAGRGGAPPNHGPTGHVHERSD